MWSFTELFVDDLNSLFVPVCMLTNNKRTEIKKNKGKSLIKVTFKLRKIIF